MLAKKLSRIPDLVGSRRLSFILIGVLASYYVILLIFSAKIHKEGVIGISYTLPFRVLYIALFANLLACTMRRTPGWIRRCRKTAAVPDDAQPDHVMALEGSTPAETTAAAEKVLADSRFSAYAAEEAAGGVRGRYSALGSLISHWGMVIVLLGVVASLNTRFEGEAMVTEGEKFWGTAREYKNFSPAVGFRQWAPKVSFRLGKVEADFWEDKLLFTRLTAQMYSPADSKEKPVTVGINEPLFSNFYTASIRLTGYGFAPFYVIRNEDGKELESSWVNLVIFPPGNEDSFRVEMIPHRFYIKLYPDYRARDGKPATASMNMKNPVFYVKTASHKVVTFEGILLPYQRAEVEGYSLAFEGMKRWVTVRVVRDVGYPIIFVGTVLICLGSLWRFLIPRREVLVRLADDGRTALVYYRADALIVADNWKQAMTDALEKAMNKAGNLT